MKDVIFLFVALTPAAAQAELQVKNVPAASFLQEFGLEVVKGDIQKLLSTKDAAGVHYFVLTREIVGEYRFGSEPEQKTDIPNLRAYGFTKANGTLKQDWYMRDFGNEVYWPSFLPEYCRVADRDKDGVAEYYVTYDGQSDGLDAKPLKIIVYNKGKKYKATAYYPEGNVEDHYHIEYDPQWRTLPGPIRRYVSEMFAEIRRYSK